MLFPLFGSMWLVQIRQIQDNLRCVPLVLAGLDLVLDLEADLVMDLLLVVAVLVARVLIAVELVVFLGFVDVVVILGRGIVRFRLQGLVILRLLPFVCLCLTLRFRIPIRFLNRINYQFLVIHVLRFDVQILLVLARILHVLVLIAVCQ